MRISIVSLFPVMFESVFNDSIIKRAMDYNLVTIDYYNFRDYSLDPHKKVDDTPFGGGAGMLLMCQPIIDCINDIKTGGGRESYFSRPADCGFRCSRGHGNWPDHQQAAHPRVYWHVGLFHRSGRGRLSADRRPVHQILPRYL